METNDTIRSRFETARTELTPLEVAIWALLTGSFNPLRRRAKPSADADGAHETLAAGP